MQCCLFSSILHPIFIMTTNAPHWEPLSYHSREESPDVSRCSYTFESPHSAVLLARQSRDTITLSFGEGLGIHPCFAEWIALAIPATTVPDWQNILNKSTDMDTISKITEDFIRQHGAAADPKNTVHWSECNKHVLKAMTQALMAKDIRCSDMSSFPHHSQATYYKPSEALYKVQLPANDFNVLRGLERLGVPLVSEEVSLQRTSENKNAIEGAIFGRHNYLKGNKDFLKSIGTDMVKDTNNASLSQQTEEVAKLTSLIMGAVDSFILQMVQMPIDCANQEGWPEVFSEGAAAICINCVQHFWDTRLVSKSWEFEVSLTFGQATIGGSYQRRFYPCNIEDLEGSLVASCVKDANAVQIDLKMDSIPPSSTSMVDQTGHTKQFVLPLPEPH